MKVVLVKVVTKTNSLIIKFTLSELPPPSSRRIKNILDKYEKNGYHTDWFRPTVFSGGCDYFCWKFYCRAWEQHSVWNRKGHADWKCLDCLQSKRLFCFFGFDLPCYSFSNTCKEKPDLSLNDESHKIFFNASAFKQEKNLEKKSILEYIIDRISTTDFTNKLDSLVEQTKLNEIFRGCIKNFS